MNTIGRIAAATGAAAVACTLALGLAAPANAAPLPTASSAAATPTPTPGVTGVATENGRTALVGTGVAGNRVLVNGNTGIGVLATVAANGKWTATVNPWATSFTVVQVTGGVRSVPVDWSIGDAPVAPGAPVVAPPAVGAPEKPVIRTVDTDGDRRYLTGSGTPGYTVLASFGTSLGVLTRVDAQGGWKVDVTNVAPTTVEVRQAANGKQSVPAYYSLRG